MRMPCSVDWWLVCAVVLPPQSSQLGYLNVVENTQDDASPWFTLRSLLNTNSEYSPVKTRGSRRP